MAAVEEMEEEEEEDNVIAAEEDEEEVEVVDDEVAEGVGSMELFLLKTSVPKVPKLTAGLHA